jgi:hypothetical protein
MQGQRIDFDKLMSQGTFCLSNADKQIMHEKTPECVQEFLNEGKLKDSFMDTLGIVRMEGDTAEFSDKVYYQNHAYLINHEKSKASYVDYKQKKLDAANPEYQANLKVLAENLRKEQKDNLNQQKLKDKKLNAAKKLLERVDKKANEKLERKRAISDTDQEANALNKVDAKKLRSDRTLELKLKRDKAIEDAKLLVLENDQEN